MGTALPVEVNFLRMCALGLLPATTNTSVHDVVRSVLAIQGQQFSAVPHALLSRCLQATGSDIRAAFNTRQLVRSRPMRGTVHITTAEDYHWMRLTLNHKPGSFSRSHETALRIDDQVGEKAATLVWERINSQGGSISRNDMFNTWLGELDTRHLATDSIKRRWCNLLMWRCDRQGLVVESPISGNQHHFIDARTLPAAHSKQSGFTMTSSDVASGLREVARRYTSGHGPIGVADLARWASLTKTTALNALEAALESDQTLMRCRLEGNRFTPVSRPATLNQATGILYLRRDLPDIAASERKQARRLMYLAAFDELHVGYKDRTCLTVEAGERLICPAKNGTFVPIIIKNGTLIGVNSLSKGIQWKNRPTAVLERQVHQLIAHTQQRISQ